MQKEQRSGKELFEEWHRLGENGVFDASIQFMLSLSIKGRKLLFEYDAEHQNERGGRAIT